MENIDPTVEIRYFEVWFDGSPEWNICIRGIRPPTIEEANAFCKSDVDKYGEIYRVEEISKEDAETFYDCNDMERWPIFGFVPKRPCWEDYFLQLAKDISSRSNCSRRKVGAVIVKDNHIVSTGYNGTPAGTRNCFEGGCPRCNEEHKTGENLDKCLCVHAEQNAICQAAKYGNAIDGGHIFITCSPCLTCLKLIINAGIRKVVFSEWYREFNEQERQLIEEAGIKVVHHQAKEGGSDV